MLDLLGNEIEELVAEKKQHLIPTYKKADGTLSDTQIPDYTMASLKQDRDAYFTKPEIAKRCYDKAIEIIGEDITDRRFLDPCAGNGSFYGLMPSDNRQGVDIEPMIEGVEKCSFLEWQPDSGIKYIAISNPPFGKNGSMAIAFFERLAFMCDYVAFILPMAFALEVVPKKLAKMGWYCQYSEELPDNSFYMPDENNKDYHVNCVFQVWSKNQIGKDNGNDMVCSADVFIHGNHSTYQHGLDRDFDIAIAQAFYSMDMEYFFIYEDLKLDQIKSFYQAIKFKDDDREAGIEFVKSFDWSSVANSVMHGSQTLNIKIVKDVLIENGFADSDKVCSCEIELVDTRYPDEKRETTKWDIAVKTRFYDKDFTIYRQGEELPMKDSLFYIWNDGVDIDKIASIDWMSYSVRRSNGGLIIRKKDAIQALIDAGFYTRNEDKICTCKVTLIDYRDSQEKKDNTTWKMALKYCHFGKDFEIRDYSQGLEPNAHYLCIDCKDSDVETIKEIDWVALSSKKSDSGLVIKKSTCVQALIDAGFYQISGEKSVDDYVDIFVCWNQPSGNRNKYRWEDGHIFVSSKVYNVDKLEMYYSFDDIPKDENGYFGGFTAIKCKRDKDAIISHVESLDWNELCNANVGGGLHISTSTIKEALVAGGFYTMAGQKQEVFGF